MPCSQVKRVGVAVLIVLGLTQPTAAYKTQKLTAYDAQEHIGEFAKVCGQVVQVIFRESSRSRPTFINFERKYPAQPFYAVVFGSDREKFEDKVFDTLQGSNACVIGRIGLYRGRPQIVVEQPTQLQR